MSGQVQPRFVDTKNFCKYTGISRTVLYEHPDIRKRCATRIAGVLRWDLRAADQLAGAGRLATDEAESRSKDGRFSPHSTRKRKP